MNLETLLCFLIALIPGLIWLFLLALRYKEDAETRRLILKTFLLGMCICTPAGLFNTWLLQAVGGMEGGDLVTSFFVFVFIVGPNEEGLKFLIVWSEVYRRWRFRTENDGIIFATASAIGFATYENSDYMMRYGIQVLYIRAWACILGHLCFSAIFGYYLGLAKSKKYNPKPCIAEGLFLAALFHGLYDFAVTVNGDLVYVVVPLLVVFYFCLSRGWVRPFLSIVAPRWMAPTKTYDASRISFQKRRFPVQEKGGLASKALEVLDLLEDLEDAPRLRGLEEAGRLADQRIFERVQSLTHDPVPAVREKAALVLKEMKVKLRQRNEAPTPT